MRKPSCVLLAWLWASNGKSSSGWKQKRHCRCRTREGENSQLENNEKSLVYKWNMKSNNVRGICLCFEEYMALLIFSWEIKRNVMKQNIEACYYDDYKHHVPLKRNALMKLWYIYDSSEMKSIKMSCQWNHHKIRKNCGGHFLKYSKRQWQMSNEEEEERKAIWLKTMCLMSMLLFVK